MTRLEQMTALARENLNGVSSDAAKNLMNRLDRMATVAAENGHPVNLTWCAAQWNALREKANG